MESTQTPSSERIKVRRLPARGVYDRDAVYAIVDEALYCHVGFVDDGQPFVMPTIHVRVGDLLYFHGSRQSRMLKLLCEGVPACVTMTLLDGLVLARSAFHHSMNYRSAVILGTAREVTDATEKWSALEALVEQVVRGRWTDSRQPNDKEMAATAVVSLNISECSAKVRNGAPKDDEDDYALPVWAGVLPLTLSPGEPIADPLLMSGIAVPEYIRNYRRI